MEDPHSTYNEIEAFTSLSRGTIYNIKHENLKLRKVVARWVPHELTDENRRKRVEDCRENLKMFREGKLLGMSHGFFIDKLVASRIMLYGLVKVNMQNQWFAVANLSRKSW